MDAPHGQERNPKAKISPTRRRDLLKQNMVSQLRIELTNIVHEQQAPQKKSNSSRQAKKLIQNVHVQKKNLSRDDIAACSDLEDESSSTTTDSSVEIDYNDGDDLFGVDESENEKKLEDGSKFFMKSVLEDIQSLYSETAVSSHYRTSAEWIIRSNNKYKIMWDVFVLGLVLIVSLVVPTRLAFAQSESQGYFIFYLCSDLIFLLDIFFTFFTTVSDKQQVDEISDRSFIARNYLKGWFWIDFISILPLDVALMQDQDEQQATMMVRFARIGKLYKLIRMLRLAKVLKLLKTKQQLADFTQHFPIKQGQERLVFFGVFFIFFFHISACMFIFFGTLDADMSSWMWDPYYYMMDQDQLYIMSLYFVVTTTSTVGYGDLSASTTLERIYCIVLMLAGVTAFTFISGALSSILASSDVSTAQLHESLLYLSKLREAHNISDRLFLDIRKALQYSSKHNDSCLDEFINLLPMHLRLEVSEEIHRDSFMRYDLFKSIGNKNFMAWVSARMKRQLFSATQYFYQKGDLIDNFYFQIRGVGAFVMADANNELIQIVDPVIYLARHKHKKSAKKFPVLQYFGAEDIVINVATIVHDEKISPGDFKFSANGFKHTNRRYFSVQSVQESEVLSISINDIEHMKRDFPISTSNFFRKMIQQSKHLLTDHLQTMTDKDNKFCLERWQNKGQNAKSIVDENVSRVFKMYRIKQMTNHSQQYSSMEWTKEKSESHNEESKAEQIEEEKEAEKKKAKNKRSSNLDADYMHTEFIARYIKNEEDDQGTPTKFALQKGEQVEFYTDRVEVPGVMSKLKTWFKQKSRNNQSAKSMQISRQKMIGMSSSAKARPIMSSFTSAKKIKDEFPTSIFLRMDLEDQKA